MFPQGVANSPRPMSGPIGNAARQARVPVGAVVAYSPSTRAQARSRSVSVTIPIHCPMARLRLLNHVGSSHADRVDAEPIEVLRHGHCSLSLLMAVLAPALIGRRQRGKPLLTLPGWRGLAGAMASEGSPPDRSSSFGSRTPHRCRITGVTNVLWRMAQSHAQQLVPGAN